jgi:hypothetical protein
MAEYKSASQFVDDFLSVSQSSGTARSGEILNDVFNKTNFINKEFNIPGGTKTITGSNILQQISGIESNRTIGSVAAYHPQSGKMFINPQLMGVLSPEEITTTVVHEMFHAGAQASGSLDPERLNKAVESVGSMSIGDAKYIGQQEGIADSFSRRTFAGRWI